MISIRIHSFIRWCLVVLTAISMLACGGGGGGDPAVATVSDANRVAAQNAFTATLTSAQTIPANNSQAIGTGTAIVDPGTRLLRMTVTTAGIAGTAATVNEAPVGTAGRIAFALSETAPGSGIWTAAAALTDAQLSALSAGNFYFNVVSAGNPSGEIRGQILPQLSTPALIGAQGVGTTAAGTPAAVSFKNALTGSQQVPAVATAASGLVTASIDDATKTLALAINLTGIAGTAAHLHEGAPGANGPVLLALSETAAGSGIWTGRIRLNDAQFNALLAGNYYVDVHSAAFPAGELRGQIAELQRLSRINDCRFGGFGFDSCTSDGLGLFIGFGFLGYPFYGPYDYGYGMNGYGGNDFGGTGADIGFGGFGGFDSGASADTPSPGIIF